MSPGTPVRAGLVSAPEDWPYSSVRAHLTGKSDEFVDVAPILVRFPDFGALIGVRERIGEFDPLRRAETSGRPLGSGKWIETLEEMTGRNLKRERR
jgi:putative transposase